MQIYMTKETAQKLKALAEKEKRLVSQTVEILIESYEKKSTNVER